MSDIQTLDRRAFLGAVAAGVVAAPLVMPRVAQAQTAPALVNPSFEVPAIAGFHYNPSGVGIGWVFSTGSGIQRNNSAWGASPAPDGVQTAFIQNLSTIAQIVSLGVGSYTLSFQAARRGSQIQPIRVTVDGTQIGGVVSPASSSFSPFSIPFSVATAGSHVLQFAGTDGSSDRSTFIDSVAIATNSPPPPPPSNGWDLTPGQGNVVQSGGITAGQNCLALNGAVALGLGCEADGGLAEGRYAKSIGNDSVAMGVSVEAHGDNGVARGWNNVGTGDQSEVYGVHANDRGMAGANTFASGSNGYEGNEGQAAGDAQTRRAVLRCITTGAETKRMSSNGNDYRVAFNTSLTTVDNCAFFVKGVTVARNAGQAGAWEWSVLLTRAVGAASIQLIDPRYVTRGTPLGTFALGFDSDWGVLTLNCTGTFGVIDWVASILSVECVFDA